MYVNTGSWICTVGKLSKKYLTKTDFMIILISWILWAEQIEDVCSVMVCQEEFTLPDKLPVSLHWKTKVMEGIPSPWKIMFLCGQKSKKLNQPQKCKPCVTFFTFFFWIIAILMQIC